MYSVESYCLRSERFSVSVLVTKKLNQSVRESALLPVQLKCRGLVTIDRKEFCLLGVSNTNLWIVLIIPASLYNLAVVRELKDQCFCSTLT